MCPTASALPTPGPRSLPHPDFSLVFPPAPCWVRTARDAIRTALAAANRQDLTETAVLLTSEAVTNAINACLDSGCSAPVNLHAEWTIDGSLRVLVHDDAPGVPILGPPRRREPDDQLAAGRGLLLISACSAEWGICHRTPGPGKAVWFRLVR